MARGSHERVVVTGIGAITNVGLDAPSSIKAMVEGKSGIGLLEGLSYFSEWPDEAWPVKIGGAIRAFEASDFFDAREAKRLDRFTTLAIAAALEAVRNAGIDFDKEDPTRCGAMVGSGVGGIQTIEASVKLLWDKGPGRISPYTVPRLMSNAISGDLAIRFNLQGPTDAHVTACASAGHSIADAVKCMRRGEAEVMLVGGSEAAVSPLCVGAFMNMKALSTRNDEPQKASRPFDRDRDGFVLSEGAAVLVLETEAHAKARGAEIICELLGSCATTDANHITAPEPEGKGAARAMAGALSDAGLAPEDIGYINAHGTSTPLGDAAEVAAVKSVFGERALANSGEDRVLMSSTKSMIGHCLGASGAVECLAVISALRDGVVPPTINCDSPDEGFDIDFVAHEAREAQVRYALNNTFGFGGHNLTLVMGRHEA
jgi:3-oxoacyl-[acyl-carrier-protein] synthase II